GLASVLVPLVLMVWGLRLLLNLPLGRVWLRLLALPVLVLAAATALAILPAPGFMGLPAGMGGVLGAALWRLAGLDGSVALGGGMGVAALGGLLLVFILGLSRGDWLEVGRNAGRVASISRLGGAAVAAAGGRLGGAGWTWASTAWRGWRERRGTPD